MTGWPSRLPYLNPSIYNTLHRAPNRQLYPHSWHATHLLHTSLRIYRPSYLPTQTISHIPFKQKAHNQTLHHSFQQTFQHSHLPSLSCISPMIAGRPRAGAKRRGRRLVTTRMAANNAASLRVSSWGRGKARSNYGCAARAKNEPRLIVPTIGSKLHGKANRHRSLLRPLTIKV